MNTNTNTPAALLSPAARSAREGLRDYAPARLPALSPWALRDATSLAADALARGAEEFAALRAAADSASASFALAFSRAPKSAAALGLRDGAAALLAALAEAQALLSEARALALALAVEYETRALFRLGSYESEEPAAAAEVSASLRALAARVPAEY